jgi:hypothetical protein
MWAYRQGGSFQDSKLFEGALGVGNGRDIGCVTFTIGRSMGVEVVFITT